MILINTHYPRAAIAVTTGTYMTNGTRQLPINSVSKELDELDLKVQITMKTSHIPPTSGIYMILHTSSGKVYIGSSKNVLKRMTQHIVSLFNKKHHSYKLQNLFNQHGLGSFTFTLLQECEIECLFTNEQHHMDSIPTRRRLNVNKKADGSDYLERKRRKSRVKKTTKSSKTVTKASVKKTTNSSALNKRRYK